MSIQRDPKLKSSLMSRRTMMAGAAGVVGAAVVSRSADAALASRRKFKLDLRCGSIGVRAGLRESIELAEKYGYESVNPDAGSLARMTAAERADLSAELKEKKIAWGAAGLPVDINGDDNSFRSGVGNLPKMASAMQEAGVTRVGTWVSPSHPELTYLSNFGRHARRYRECAKILRDHGQRFGLEYIGPKTLWASKRHSFIHTMQETKELFAEINVDNMGFILDSWHWYTAHETVDDLLTLTNDDVVACDLNDAPRGRAIDEQIDNQRELPMATGVIDLKGFLSALVEIGYDGPVRAEPFNAALNAMDNEPAVEATAVAMRKAFALIGG